MRLVVLTCLLVLSTTSIRGEDLPPTELVEDSSDNNPNNNIPAARTLPGMSMCSSGATLMTYDFFWRGQFAGFIVNGRFAFYAEDIPDGGIVREEQLQKLDVHFYDPRGNHLRTYNDNHLSPVDQEEGRPYVNFAFDVLSQELLQDGTWNVDDNENRCRNGFMMGEGNPSLRSEFGVQTGLAFWSRPGDDKVPHLHVDDWNLDEDGNGELGFPISYSSHEDASFPYATTMERLATGKVPEEFYQAYENGTVVVNRLASDLGSYGQRVKVTPVYDGACMEMEEAEPDRVVSRSGGSQNGNT